MPVEAAVPPSLIFDGVVPPSSRPLSTVPPCPPFQAHCPRVRGNPKGGATGAAIEAGVNNGKIGGTRGDTLQRVMGGKRAIARVLRMIDKLNEHATYRRRAGPPISRLTAAELEAERVLVFARLGAARQAKGGRYGY